MKKNIKMLIAALVVLVLFAGGYFFLTKWEPEKPAEDELQTEVEETEYLLRTDKENIDYVQFCNGSENYTIKNDENFTVEGYSSYVFDKSALSIQISNSCSVAVSHKIDGGIDNLQSFGLENAEKSVLVALKDGSRQKLLIGNSANFEGEYYAMLEGGEFVCTIAEFEVENLMQSPSGFRTKNICTLDAANVKALTIEKGGRKEISVVYDESFVPENEYQGVAFTVTYPYSGVTASPDKLESVFEKFSSLTADEIVEENPKNLSTYGLDKPYVMTVTDTEGKITSLKMGNYGEGSSVYVMLNDLPVVYLANCPFYEVIKESKADDYVERFINLFNIQTVKEIIFTAGEESHTLGITKKDEENYTYKIDGKLVSEKPFKKIYQSIIGIIATDFVNEAPSGEVKCNIAFNFNDGSTKTVTYYTYDERYCIVKGVNGMNCLALTKSIDSIINSFKQEN